MRATISRVLKKPTGGLFSKAKEYAAIHVSAQFSEEEQEVVKRWELGSLMFIDRNHPADGKDISNGHPHFYAIYVNELMSGKIIETVLANPTDAYAFEEEFKAKLGGLKALLDANRDFQPGSATIEL